MWRIVKRASLSIGGVVCACWGTVQWVEAGLPLGRTYGGGPTGSEALWFIMAGAASILYAVFEFGPVSESARSRRYRTRNMRSVTSTEPRRMADGVLYEVPVRLSVAKRVRLALVGPVQRVQGECDLLVRVFDINGDPVRQSEIVLRLQVEHSTVYRAAGRTDLQGQCWFRGVPMGTGEVVASGGAAGQQMTAAVTLVEGSNQLNVRLVS